MSDASLGVGNLGGFLRSGDEATSLPATLALAATFDPDLALAAGEMLGAEAHAKGFNIQLAGGVNLTREPRNGRNFEYAGEDPCWPAGSSAPRWPASRAATWSRPSSISP
jgi:beta-glucosidase